MRIEALSAFLAVVWVTAVLCPRLVAANNLTSSITSRRSRDHLSRGHNAAWKVPLDDKSIKRMTYREMQNVIRQEGHDKGRPVDCCPTVSEMSEPIGGRTWENAYVDLYQDGKNIQRFFEYSCRADVLDKPCRFVDRKLSNQSRCVQKYSYTYAIISTRKDTDTPGDHGRHHHKEHQIPAFGGTAAGDSPWALDYIQIRSGCSCEILPKPKKKKASATKAKRARSKQRLLRENDSDFEP